jgi:histidinol dehydrogenase
MSREKLGALALALKQIRWFARKQKEIRFVERRFRTPLGYTVIERYVALDRVGGYVPGGLASYPSTVLMICGPAREAGVKDIVLATPPGKDGRVNEGVLAAAKLCGVREVIKLGGAQAIAAFAYGTKSIMKVGLIAGPGNKYVTEAKRQAAASGLVSIDALAGPTELLVLADESANPEYVSEDILSQAEHGNKTLCGVVSDSLELLSQVKEIIQGPQSERERLESIRQSYLFSVRAKNLRDSVKFAQAFAPEHLEVMVSEGLRVSKALSRSGLVLVGEYSPCSATDYVVGTDHILPTGGSAARISGVSVGTFLRRVEVVQATSSSLKKSLNALSTLALMEGLPNHARAANIRFRFRFSRKREKS